MTKSHRGVRGIARSATRQRPFGATISDPTGTAMGTVAARLEAYGPAKTKLVMGESRVRLVGTHPAPGLQRAVSCDISLGGAYLAGTLAEEGRAEVARRLRVVVPDLVLPGLVPDLEVHGVEQPGQVLARSATKQLDLARLGRVRASYAHGERGVLLDDRAGAELMALDLGFESASHLIGWASRHPQIWGNTLGNHVFTMAQAWGWKLPGGRNMPLSHASNHLRAVATRLPNGRMQ